MKKHFNFLKNTILLLGGGLALLTAFTSCENFLKGADVRKDLEEAIEIANTQPVTYYVTTEKGAGTVIPQSINVKKKENFQLKFTLEENWKFICWQAVDKETGEVLENAVYFENPQSTETKAYIITPNENIQIYAKCIQYPAVVSIEPSAATYANTPITIKFNIPVEAPETTTAESLFTFDNDDEGDNTGNIILTCNGIDINYLFEKPVFNEEKTELVIIPKADANKGVLLKNYIIDELNTNSITVDISFNNIFVKIEDEQYPVESKNLSVYYIPVVDEIDPLKKNFFITRDSSITFENAETFTGNKFKTNDISTKNAAKVTTDQEYTELLMNNSCDGTIYIYGHYIDGDKGIFNVVVNEVMKRTLSSTYAIDKLITSVYDGQSENVSFKTINGETWFLIKHVITPYYDSAYEINKGGLISLEVHVNDFCYNTTIEQYSFLTILPNNLDFRNVVAPISDSVNISEWTDLDTYKTSLKNFFKSFAFYKEENESYSSLYYAGHEYAYDKDSLSIKLQYTNVQKKIMTVNAVYTKLNPMPKIKNKNRDLKISFEEMDDFEIFPGTQVKIILTNYLGVENEFVLYSSGNNLLLGDKERMTFPPENSKLFVDVSEDEESNKKYVQFYHPKQYLQQGILVRKDSQNKIQCKDMNSNKYEIQSGYSYSLMNNGIIYDAWFNADDDTNVDPVTILVDRVEFKKGENDFFIATVYLNEESLRFYDYVIADNKLLAEDNYYTCTLTQKGLYYEEGDSEQNMSLGWIYGFKGNKKLYDKLCKIPRYSKEGSSQEIKNKYDNTLPIFVGNMENSNIKITMIDNWSGIKEGTLEIRGNTYTFDKDNPSCTIPVLDFYKSNNVVYNIHCTGSDNAGNVLDEYCTNNVLFKEPLWAKIKKTAGYKNIQKFETVYSHVNSIGLNCYEFNETKNSFAEDSTSFVSLNSFNTNITSNTDTPTFTANSYIKIVLQENFTYTTKFTYDETIYINYSNPMYYYNGAAAAGSSENNFIIPNGSSKEKVVIGSDYPVFVHTVVTSRPLKECKTWDYPEWEYFNEYVGEKVLHCETSSPKVYTIPVNEIGGGKYYVVIAHYADGDALMSDIMTQ